VQHVMEAVHLRPGEVILDVGCGSGVLDRWLARSTGQANRIIGSSTSNRGPHTTAQSGA